MTEDLKIIYSGSATVIKGKEFLSTKAYIEPFVERLSKITTKFICQVKPADQVSIENNKASVIYNKVLVTAILPEAYDFKVGSETFHKVACMAYALDIRKPTVKFYIGCADSNLNFYTFGSNNILLLDIDPETAMDYSGVNNLVDKLTKTDLFEKMLDQLTKVTINKNLLMSKLGEWVDYVIKSDYINSSGKTKLATSIPIEVYKDLQVDKDSDFYTEKDPTIFTILKAFAHQIEEEDRDLTNKFEKTTLINGLLKLNGN